MKDNSGKTNGYKSANGFQFTLSGTAVNGATTPAGDQTTPYVVSGTTSGIGAASGTIKFQNIPVGTYTLSETRVAPEYQFGLDNTLEAVTKMADIQVKVTAAGIAFGRLDGSGTEVSLASTTDETKKAGTDSVSGAVDEQVLTVYNKLKIGSISGTKVGVGNQKDGKVDLAGAKFGLYKKGSDALYATTTAVPPNVITFTGVPFGDYDVQEIDAPTGYVRSDTKYPVTVQAESPATEIDADTTKPGAQAVENQAILKTITLLKVDQNGAPLGSDRLNTGFTITKTDTINPTIPAAIYTVPTSVGNDKDEPDVTLPEFYIKVEAGDDAQAKTHTKITVSTQDDFGTSTGAITRTITQNNSDTTPYDFANLSSSATLFAIENRLKYGTIAIHKIGAEKNNSGQATSYTEQGAIPEVTFEIYRDTDGDGKWLPIDLVLTLKTDAKGHFPKTVNGKYTDANSNVDNQILSVALLAGDYVLHEKNAPAGYAMLKTDIQFQMTDKAQVVTFIYDGKTGAATTDANLSKKPFYNLIPRGTVSFQKVAADKPETVVHDAVFALVSKDSGANQGKAVAFVTEVVDPQTSKTGTYRLTGTTEALKKRLPSEYSYVEKLGTIPYVREDASQAGVFKVLSGEYALLELETEKDYQKPTDVVVVDSLTVEDEKDTVLGTGGKITNALKTADITIQKQLEDFALSTPKSYQEHTKTPAGKFEFTLAGKTGSGGDFTKTHVVGAAEFAAGEVWFQAIPVGSYTLKETAHPDNYVALDPNGIAVTVAVDKTGTAVVSYAGGTATPDPYVIRNDVYRNTIYAKKVTTLGQQNYPVSGAVFGLFDSANRELARATSDGDGNLKFADVPCLAAPDTYYVKEISAPSGYTPDETHYVIAVTRQGVALSDGTAAGTEITESKPLLIHNAATLVSVKLKKINQNGDPIKGSEIPLNFTLTEKPVGGDRFKVTASNAEDGSVTFSGLRYGTYQLTEAASDHVTGEEQVTAEIEVSKGSSNQTKVSVTYNHQTRSMEQAAANPDFDFTADAALAIVNEVDYGLVQINKIGTEKNIALDASINYTEIKAISDVEFEFYRDTDGDGKWVASDLVL
ncbi:MAG: prealbumin-like fold domain-containing protein, partial [Hungatella sp.]